MTYILEVVGLLSAKVGGHRLRPSHGGLDQIVGHIVDMCVGPWVLRGNIVFRVVARLDIIQKSCLEGQFKMFWEFPLNSSWRGKRCH